ncbi:MAG: EpsI family protein [Bryobacteraceae bacterium]
MVFLKSTAVKVVTLLLLLQIGVSYSMRRAEYVPPLTPLKQFPAAVGPWKLDQEGVIEQEILDLLRADDTISRSYVDPATGERAHFYMAVFKSQRAGVQPHSPRVCLPGSGWTPEDISRVEIPVAGWVEPTVTVNKYVVAHGEDRSVVLYWFQTHNRVIASEYAAKAFTILDAARFHRSDTSIVRLIVNAHGAAGVPHATEVGLSAVKDFFGPVREILPK